MLYGEYRLEDEIAVVKRESWEDGHTEAFNERNRTIACNALAKGSTPEFVQEITGLDLETIQKLNN